MPSGSASSPLITTVKDSGPELKMFDELAELHTLLLIMLTSRE